MRTMLAMLPVSSLFCANDPEMRTMLAMLPVSSLFCANDPEMRLCAIFPMLA